MLRIYTRSTSVFLRALLLGTAGTLGWWIGVRREHKELNLFLLKNFKNFDKDVQNGLQSGDSRYFRHYLRKANIIEDVKNTSQMTISK